MQTDQHTIREFTLNVGDGHELYVHDWGNEFAKTPFVFLHGGPGSQSKDKHKSVFDPSTQRVIFFDQRGCGNSTPYGEIAKNTTQDLVGDITKIADHLNIKKFYLHGSSWGSALALFYALANPDRVVGLIIGGVYTVSQRENDWLYRGKFANFFPEIWNDFAKSVPAKFRKNPAEFHFDKIASGDDEERKRAAYELGKMQRAVMCLDDRFVPADYETYDPAPSQIEIHYIANGGFVPDRYILDNARKLTMPIHVVQGRYDFVCPPITAYELCREAPNAKLYWTISGHTAEHENENVFRAIFAGLEQS